MQQPTLARILIAALVGLSVSALLCSSVATAQRSSSPQFDIALVRGNLNSPTEVVGHPSDPGIVYVLLKEGIIQPVGTTRQAAGSGGPIRHIGAIPTPVTPLLDLTAVVDSALEQGLLGLAFHPDFASNRRFFVKYNEFVGPQTFSYMVIDEYRMAVGTPYRIDPSFAPVRIFCAETLEQHHMGGGIHFGADGRLWAPLGDSGDISSAQDIFSPYGKVLRFDVDIDVGQQAQCGVFQFYVPNDNPPLGGVPYIFSVGLRNPYGWSFDRTAEDLWIGDVGQSSRDEIDFMSFSSAGGENYGWPSCEGNLPFMGGSCGGGQTSPVYTYNHVPAGGAVIGGFVYRGTDVPSLQGHYLFADHKFFGLDEILRSFPAMTPGSPTNHGNDLSVALYEPVAFGENASGELFILDHRLNPKKGRLFRIISAR